MPKYKCESCQDACSSEYFGVCEFITPIQVDEMVCPISSEECDWQKVED